MKSYRVGIIGCGGISGSHFEGLSSTGRAEVACAWDTDPEALAQAAGKWQARACSSAEQLMQADIDMVVIATPGFAHREYVEMAGRAGKHVLCEKPIALNLEDAYAIRDAVSRSGIVFITGFSYRFDPALARLKAAQESGDIGDTVSAWSRVHAPASSDRWREIKSTGHWRASMELSGGRINEFCSHSINWLLWVLGLPKSVYGRALHVTEGFELDDADYALIECEGGTALLEVNRHAGVERVYEFGVMGHQGSFVLKDDSIRQTPMDRETVPIEPAAVQSKHEHWLTCIDDGKVPLTSVDDAIDTLKVCLAFNRSAQTGAVEQV